MTVLRSTLFNLFFFSWTSFLVFSLWLFMPFSVPTFRRFLRFWPAGVFSALKGLAGIDYEVRGRENLPPGAAILAAKHQSAWDTMFFLLFDIETTYIMKTELLRIPFWGWYMRKTRNIAIDRQGGAGAMRQMIRETRSILGEGRRVVIFPEGTRVKPGEAGQYQPGIAALYAQTDAPVVPVAVNSGLFWGRRDFRKKPGTIIVEFLEPMPRGLDRKDFMAQLEDRVETATNRLVEECGGAVD